MKKLIILSFFSLNFSAFSQRYLTPVFSELDSLIGGIYGNAVNSLGNNQDLLFDFYAPDSDTVQKRPLLLYVHGGGFNSGTRTYPSIKLLCQRMAKKGYAVASIDYRLDPNFQLYNSETDRSAMTNAMHDAKQAIRYFKANAELYKIDTTKIFIGGESAGAITAMMAAYIDKQEEMNPYPMSNPNNPVGNNNNSHVGNGVSGTLCLCGMLLDTAAIESPNDPPILWIHGDEDAYIPIFLAFNIVLRAAEIGLPIQTKVYEGATHCPWYYGNPNWEIYLDSTVYEITNFLYPKVTNTLSLNKVQNNEISLFPNPFTDYLNIGLDKQYSKINISVATVTGRIFKTWKFQNKKNIQLYLKDLKKGFYLLKIELDDEVVFTKKIICNR